LLAEAGYPNGFSLKLIASKGWLPAFEMSRVMEIVVGYFEAIGLRPKIRPMDNPEILRIARAGKHVGNVYGWKDVFRDSWAGKQPFFFHPGANAITHFQDPELSAFFCEIINDREEERRIHDGQNR
jgi:ABC-type transport system substrate-binding protein